MRATPERAAQGVKLEVIDGVQRVRSGPGQLRSSGRISDNEMLATERWYKNYALAVHGARDSNSSGSGGGQEGLSLAILQAVEAHNAATAAVGQHGHVILRAFVADGRSLRSMASSGPARAKAARAVVATIKRLAERITTSGTTRGRWTGCNGLLRYLLYLS